jgi:hypothetical protein
VNRTYSLACRTVFTALLVLTLVAASLPKAVADTALISFSGGFLATSGSDQLYGWQFNVLTSINVTALGVGDEFSNGLSIAHDVGIFRTSDQALLTSTTVPSGTAATLDAGFRYVTLGSAVTLAPDNYVIAMTMPEGTEDRQSIANSSVTTTPEIQYVTSAFDGSMVLAFPDPGFNGAFAEGMFGPNFQFNTQVVPEPSCLAFAGSSFCALGFASQRRRRQ